MNTPLRVGMAAVIGLLLLGAGIYFFGGSGPGIIGQPAATSPAGTGSPSTATATPSAGTSVVPAPSQVAAPIPIIGTPSHRSRSTARPSATSWIESSPDDGR